MTTRVFEGRVNDVYPMLIETILKEGKEVKPRGTTTLELNPAILEIHSPEQRLVTSYGRPVNVAFALVEVAWILAGAETVVPLSSFNSTISNYSDNGHTFNAAYGKRIRWQHGHDQIEDMIAALLHDPDTRQATLTIAMPGKDRNFDPLGHPHATFDRACNVFSHAMIRDGRLNWLQILRSNDALWGVPYNLMQWTSIMEYVAGRLEVPLGKYTMLSDSMHIYSEGESAAHFPEAQSIRRFDLYQELGFLHAPLTLFHITECEELLRDITSLTKMMGVDGLETQLGMVMKKWTGMEREILAQAGLYLYYKMAPSFNITPEGVFDFAINNCLDRVYTAAQMRFFHHNRFRQDSNSEQAMFYGRCVNEYGNTVSDWIFGYG